MTWLLLSAVLLAAPQEADETCAAGDLTCAPDTDTTGGPIEVKRTPPQPTMPAGRDAVLLSFARVIERGAPVYNSGDPGRCAAMYQTAIESALILARDDLTVLDQQVLQQALQLAASQGEQEAAWTFRYAMDAVLGQ